MTFLDRISRFVSGPRSNGRETGETFVRAAATTIPESRNYLDALNVTNHRTPVPGLGLGANYSLGYSRSRLASICRYLWDNVGMVYYATDLLANYSTPMIPRAATSDRNWNDDANQYFDDWSERADFAGNADFSDIQRSASILLDLDGEAFAYWLADDSGAPRVRLIESPRCSKSSSEQDRVRDGVQLDEHDRIVGYWFDDKLLVPLAQVQHVREHDVASRVRALSPIRRGANDVRDAKDIASYQKILAKLSATIPMVIEGSPLEQEPFGMAPTVEGESADTDTPSAGFSVADLVGGTIPVLSDGRVLKPINTQASPANAIDTIAFLAGSFVAGLGLPPAFFLDEKLTGPNQRAVNAKAQKRFEQRKSALAKFGRATWLRIIAYAIADGALPSVRGWQRCDFIGPSEITIDAGREMAQERQDVAAGLMTRREHYGSRGKSWRRETDQAIAELDYILDRAEELAAQHNLPVESILTSFGMVGQSKPKDAPFANTPNIQGPDPAV